MRKLRMCLFEPFFIISNGAKNEKTYIRFNNYICKPSPQFLCKNLFQNN